MSDVCCIKERDKKREILQGAGACSEFFSSAFRVRKHFFCRFCYGVIVLVTDLPVVFTCTQFVLLGEPAHNLLM